MDQPSPDDLYIAAVVILLALISFIAVLYLNRKDNSKKKSGAATPTVTAPGQAEAGTVFKEEDGRVVRRSTRQHKPTTPLANRLAAAADDAAVTPKSTARTPRTTERTARKTAGKSPAPAETSPTTPRTGRRGRPPKA